MDVAGRAASCVYITPISSLRNYRDLKETTLGNLRAFPGALQLNSFRVLMSREAIVLLSLSLSLFLSLSRKKFLFIQIHRQGTERENRDEKWKGK